MLWRDLKKGWQLLSSLVLSLSLQLNAPSMILMLFIQLLRGWRGSFLNGTAMHGTAKQLAKSERIAANMQHPVACMRPTAFLDCQPPPSDHESTLQGIADHEMEV